ncbi:hypothetical protein TREVI0001_0249 [Treponema vincentii ATCC 35580]|uniref:Uncharacterized protein n=1 Tax=Treponema vincentii ATCC 35580 TaxID=596324 RepID=C8PU06_9SPIR|nr:hypothetical protein TREVI0001_0249 [Treponema vincentii ATCC 35580]
MGKKTPVWMIEENCHTNWDSMRAVWQKAMAKTRKKMP